MAEGANVRSVDAILEFAAALRVFEDDAGAAMMAIEQEVTRAVHWIEHDAVNYWKNQARVRYERVVEARQALESCMVRTVGDEKKSCIDEKKALEKAKRRLQEAEEKLEIVKAWSTKARREVDEYRGRVGRLQSELEGGIPRTVGLLERSVTALERYMERPSGGVAPSVTETTGSDESGS